MPHLKSAVKNLRKSRRKTALNLKLKAELHKVLRGPITARTLPIATKAIDKAAKRGVISKGKAARLKSGLSKKVK
uniref:Small ribosomal subunit protein bS20 n=1 Tax=candidate division WWE3 bacterium TaxID=2053526 RepID=A0A831Z152_UNCKA